MAADAAIVPSVDALVRAIPCSNVQDIFDTIEDTVTP
jgi:hypothetical protein